MPHQEQIANDGFLTFGNPPYHSWDEPQTGDKAGEGANCSQFGDRPQNRSVEGNAIVRRFLPRNTVLSAAFRQPLGSFLKILCAQSGYARHRGGRLLPCQRVNVRS